MVKAPYQTQYTLGHGFGYKRGGGEIHPGRDLAAAEGSPVTPYAPGRVVQAGYSTSYGNFVVVEHRDDNGYYHYSKYAHLKNLENPNAPFVKPGDIVGQDTQLGQAGNTGKSSGPHLHFEIFRNKDPNSDGRLDFFKIPRTDGGSFANNEVALDKDGNPVSKYWDNPDYYDPSRVVDPRGNWWFRYKGQYPYNPFAQDQGQNPWTQFTPQAGDSGNDAQTGYGKFFPPPQIIKSFDPYAGQTDLPWYLRYPTQPDPDPSGASVGGAGQGADLAGTGQAVASTPTNDAAAVQAATPVSSSAPGNSAPEFLARAHAYLTDNFTTAELAGMYRQLRDARLGRGGYDPDREPGFAAQDGQADLIANRSLPPRYFDPKRDTEVTTSDGASSLFDGGLSSIRDPNLQALVKRLLGGLASGMSSYDPSESGLTPNYPETYPPSPHAPRRPWGGSGSCYPGFSRDPFPQQIDIDPGFSRNPFPQPIDVDPGFNRYKQGEIGNFRSQRSSSSNWDDSGFATGLDSNLGQTSGFASGLGANRNQNTGFVTGLGSNLGRNPVFATGLGSGFNFGAGSRTDDPFAGPSFGTGDTGDSGSGGSGQDMSGSGFGLPKPPKPAGNWASQDNRFFKKFIGVRPDAFPVQTKYGPIEDADFPDSPQAYNDLFRRHDDEGIRLRNAVGAYETPRFIDAFSSWANRPKELG